jgi:septal ring factor EnvC (AmiA/AmiB activator)
MTKAAEEAGQKITELKSKLEAEKAEKSQLEQELTEHKSDRESAKADLEQATSIREKEHAEFVEASGDQKSNLEALTAAIAALEKGMGAFIQTTHNGRLERIIRDSNAVDDYEKSSLLDLLQSKASGVGGDYSSQSGEITGMMKAMKDEMDKDLGGIVKDEEAAQKGFEELAAAKTSQIQAASEAIESKTVRAGELAVSVTTTADDIEDTTAEMKETQAFVANLASTCATKKKEWAERQSIRAEEISAVSEAIKILNDDDALDLFKKSTLALSQAPTYLQKKSGSSVSLRAGRILAMLSKRSGIHATQLALMQSSLLAKKVDFSKILTQIEGMTKVLNEEQTADDEQKAFCEKDIASTDTAKTDTEEAIAMSEASISEMTDESGILEKEIASLQQEIKDLDKAVAESTETRKEEHAEFLTFQTQNNAALELIDKAKNRLFKFYRPTLHKEEPEKELTEEEQLLKASGAEHLIPTEAPAFIQVRSDVAPPPPPATWDAYQKKDGKSNGVIGLMEMLMKELEDGITTSRHEEDTAQKDYERLMSDSQASRETMVESITTKEKAKADVDSTIVATKEKLASQNTELTNIKQTLAELHAQCDFLIENYDLRKEARATEIEGLKNAKSVLNGASFE